MQTFEITITGNGILFKGDRIILPTSLQEKAIALAHRGTHPGQSGLERRLRYHFFFHSMLKKVETFIQNCRDCQIFTNKKVFFHPMNIDLFGPMPSPKYLVVVQDLASRYPSAKIVQSTQVEKVLPALSEIYDTYGNPRNQLSNNGPPFNSKAMGLFAQKETLILKNLHHCIHSLILLKGLWNH